MTIADASTTATLDVTNFTNPVYAGDFPDPFVLRAGDAYYACATNIRGANAPTLRSTDLSHWEMLGDALPHLPTWAASGKRLTWAPSILPRGDVFVMYYTVRHTRSRRQTISCAVAAHPAGPYVDMSGAPLVSQIDLGGAIDPSPFADDDGAHWLLWKNDGNSCGMPVRLWAQRLGDDGLSLLGRPAPLLGNDQPWEGNLIEAPSVVKHAGRYYLFYSANDYASARYAVGYAVADTITGPYRKPLNRPVLASSGLVSGPGGQEFFTDRAGDLWMAYHAWDARAVGYRRGGRRSLHLGRVFFADGVPFIASPAAAPSSEGVRSGHTPW